jgi:hypothetical protein
VRENRERENRERVFPARESRASAFPLLFGERRRLIRRRRTIRRRRRRRAQAAARGIREELGPALCASPSIRILAARAGGAPPHAGGAGGVEVWEEEEWSSSYPGLRCVYRLHRVDAQVEGRFPVARCCAPLRSAAIRSLSRPSAMDWHNGEARDRPWRGPVHGAGWTEWSSSFGPCGPKLLCRRLGRGASTRGSRGIFSAAFCRSVLAQRQIAASRLQRSIAVGCDSVGRVCGAAGAALDCATDGRCQSAPAPTPQVEGLCVASTGPSFVTAEAAASDGHADKLHVWEWRRRRPADAHAAPAPAPVRAPPLPQQRGGGSGEAYGQLAARAEQLLAQDLRVFSY